MTGFGDRLVGAMDAHGPVCVGIDPHPGLLADWGLRDDVDGLRTFALRVVDALAGRVAALKPQSAFFERHGSRGVAVLEEVIAATRATGTELIVDAKRGDIGSTMAGYADAYLREGSPLAGDAVTLSPYLGAGSLAPAVEVAHAAERGIFVLCLTSNPEGESVQHAVAASGVSVAAGVARWAAEQNATQGRVLGPVGLVVGATVGRAPEWLGIDLEAVRGPILAPGVGAQGAGAAELRAVFGSARAAVLASTSRGVLRAGPELSALRGAAATAVSEAAAALR